MNKDFNSVGVASGRWTAANDYRVDNFMAYHHDYAIWTSMTHAFNFCKYLGKKTIHFMEYDCLLDTFQYRQTFKKITSVQDYYANRPEGWQLERLFL